MLRLLTRPPKLFFPGCFRYHLKTIARKMLGLRRGPDGVLLSLMRGLDLIGCPYSLNTKPDQGDQVNVLSNIDALRWAIDAKRGGKISKLIAGPNLVILPDEHGSILASPEIDSILATSQWVKDLYAAALPGAEHKISIWPAGIRIPAIDASQERSGCIVFKKTVEEKLCREVIAMLESMSIPFTVIEYGKFSQKRYFDLLKKSRFMIYLQETESQGIALQEAWGHDVPTLVWNRGYFKSPDGRVIRGNTSAPFLTEKSGMLFGSKEEFGEKLTEFLSRLETFEPREYCANTLSDRSSAEIYARILKQP